MIKIIIFFALSIANLTALEYIDLGYGYDENTPVFPGGKKFAYTKENAVDDNGVIVSSKEFEVGEHSGTHLDAPYHFYPHGKKVAEIETERLLPNGILVDASNETAGNSEYVLPVSKLIQWEKDNGPIKPNTVLLVRFGWGSKYPNIQTYYGGLTRETLHFPGLSVEAAIWIVETQKIVGVGVDTPSVDPGVSLNFTVHGILSRNDIYNLENVNLTSLLPPKFNLIVMPIKLVNGTGGPVRIIAGV